MSYVVPGGDAKVPSLSPPVGKEWVPIAIHRCCWNSTENPSILNTFFTFTTCFSVKIVKNHELLGTKKRKELVYLAVNGAKGKDTPLQIPRRTRIVR